MAAPRRVIEVAFTEQELADLERISRSRTEPASHVQRACMLLTYRRTPSLYATGRAIGVTHQTVERCLRRARIWRHGGARRQSASGREPTITGEAKMLSSIWPAAKPRIWAIRTKCGRRGCWPNTCANVPGGRPRMPGQSRPGNLVQDFGRA